MRIQVLALLALISIFITAPASCQETGPLGFGSKTISQEMETDRPDFTEGASSVSPGHLQLEGGYLFTYDDSDGAQTREHLSPQLLLRVGLLSDLELRIAWDGYLDSETKIDSEQDSITTSTSGTSDLNLGFKHRLYEAGAVTPDVSIIVQASVPTGSSDVSANDTEPEVKLIWARSLDERWALAGNINFASPVVSKERFFEASTSLTLSRALGERFGTYIEYFGFFPNSSAPDSSATHFLNAGLTFAASDSLQFDILSGAGLNKEAEDFFAGCGFAYRY